MRDNFHSDRGFGTFPGVSPASSMSLASLSTTLQLAKEASEVDPFSNCLQNSCSISPALYLRTIPSISHFHACISKPIHTLRWLPHPSHRAESVDPRQRFELQSSPFGSHHSHPLAQ
ncbi:unnamed protein product [Protopolystoma xenopodis]|uniref:Uncharacterized protein n=1 Tax=Protopolystoma xenopodis TaxID=117903 RepID=A0A448WBC1_9PLAT|nr:unnamed protein product [Protopolystoma xenopodis]